MLESNDPARTRWSTVWVSLLASGQGGPGTHTSESDAAIGQRIVDILGPEAARDLLGAITRSDADRAALIGRLAQRDDATWLAELLIEIETDPDDITRLRLIDGLEGALG